MQLLLKENPEARIVVDGYECGYDEIEMIHTIQVTPNAKKKDKTWEGEFIDKLSESQNSETVLYFPRKS